jgi:tRNA A-37 threonylcarbamoyl transferase component Bud32
LSADNHTGELEGPERLIGQRILDFVLKDVLGAGGMSVVYRGEHRVTGQEVAIKILPPELAIHDDLKARFVEEARVLAKLEHPNIVGLNNFTESGGRLCLIMSFVAGKTFEQMFADGGKVDPQEVVRVGVEVCKALEYAHGQNVIHRDIKPSNVLVRPDGAVKVTDFGIAKIIGQSRLTSTGQTMGTVRYMSPEQVRGRALDNRSDLYSLGITLYEALAGKTPFDGENQFDIMQQQISKAAPPLSSHGVDVPASLERVLKTALEKDPNKRFADARSFREALENLSFESENTPAGTPRARKVKAAPNRARAVALGLGLGVAVVGAAAGVFRLRHSVAPPAAVQPTPAPVALRPAWPAPYAIRDVALAVDQTFDSDKLRIQSAAPRDVTRVRDRVQEAEKLLREFLAASQSAGARALAARFQAPPLTLTVVPPGILSRPDLWPGYNLEPGKSYGSRYVEPHKTLFVADAAGFERRELAYGIALHVMAPEKALSTDDCLDLADKFEAWYLAHAAP